MRRLNLQLFALNTNTSIVDYLKSIGSDSSYENREKLAKEMGIANYQGTAEQNTAMLNALKNSSAGTTKTPAVNQNVAGAGRTTLNGVNQETINKMNSSFSASGDVTNAQQAASQQLAQLQSLSGKTNLIDQALWDVMNSNFQASDKVNGAMSEADTYLGALKDIAGKKDIISQDTWNAMNTPFASSSAYQEAMKYTNGLLEQLNGGKTSYSDQITDLMNQIQNRDKFSYDPNTDALFMQALASAMGSGQQAMQDTLGQAAALTGGYGSSYATAAGNQAYNAYIQDAYNNLPEYYQMALQAYQMEGQDMYDQLAMLNNADAQEYERLFNSWNANFNNSQQMYQNEYQAWQDAINNAFNSANMQLQEHGQLYDQAYNTYNAVQNNAQQQYQNEYGAWQDKVNNAFNSANMQMQESAQLFDQAYNTYGATQSMADTLYAQEYQKWADEVNNAFNYAGMTNADYWNNQEFNESVRQFNENLALNKAQLEASIAAKSSGSGSSGNGLKEPSETQMKKALEAYNTGGDTALYQYVDSLGSDVDMDAIDTYINQYGQLPLEQREYTKTKDTFNWLWGNDNNDIVTDQYGNEFRIDELPESLRSVLTKLKLDEIYGVK